MMNLQVPMKQEQGHQEFSHAHQTFMSEENESASSASYTDDEDHEKGVLLSCVSGENPKKSFRLVDFDPGSVVLQDRESETETSKNLTRRRSKRTRKSSTLVFKNQEQAPARDDVVAENVKKRVSKLKSLNWVAEPETVSSVSDTTTEDVAYCLMMLSRDRWKGKQVLNHYEDEYEDEEEREEEKSIDETEDSEEQKMSFKSRGRGKYKCETCNKVFRSYQALGGHRASHKKIKISATPLLKNAAGTPASYSVTEKKIHECPFCCRVFTSGQALGGHKRSHFTNGRGGVSVVLASATAVSTPAASSTKFGEHLIDLNLPVPVEQDGEFSQVELSAVSDAEFVNPIKE